MKPPDRKTLLVLAGCAVWLAVLGWIDRVTGYELGLFAFYTAPVAAAAWHLGQRPGIVMALLASLIWYVADRLAGDRYSSPFYGYWNTGMHFTSFIINAVTFAKIKSNLDQRHQLERDLAVARAQLRELTGTPLRCPRCQEPQPAEPVLATMETCLPTPNRRPGQPCARQSITMQTG